MDSPLASNATFILTKFEINVYLLQIPNFTSTNQQMDYTKGIDQISSGFSDAGIEACRALDYNARALKSDFNFLSRLADDLHNKTTLEWKFEQRYITEEGMQIAMDSLKKLPKIPYVLHIIGQMRELFAKLHIDEVVVESQTEPKIGDRVLIKFVDGERTVNIDDIKDGFVYFNVTGGERTGTDNIKFTRNLQMGQEGASFSIGEGWVIVDYAKIQNAEPGKTS